MNRYFGFAVWPLLQFSILTRAVVGDISWRPPGWAEGVSAGVKKRPILSGFTFMVLLVVLVGGGWAWNWYAHLPKPPTVDWAISSNPGFYRQSVTLTFDSSVAALECIGKDVSKQATLSPKLDGKWTWTSGTIGRYSPSC